MTHHLGAMKAIKVVRPGIAGYYILPETHKELFAHCANGPDCSIEVFEKTVRPLLMAHGIDEVKIS